MTTSRTRRGTDADLPRVRAIQAAALTDPWPALLDAVPSGVPGLVVLEVGSDDAGRVVGYALVLSAARGDGPGVAYLPEFAIAPGWQGRGLGSALLTDLLARLADRDVGAVRVTARADDDRARGFYLSHDFEVRDRFPGHYADADGLLLERSLSR